MLAACRWNFGVKGTMHSSQLVKRFKQEVILEYDSDVDGD
jgi:hypothetical protein